MRNVLNSSEENIFKYHNKMDIHVILLNRYNLEGNEMDRLFYGTKVGSDIDKIDDDYIQIYEV